MSENTVQLGGDANAYPTCAMYVKRWLVDSQGLYIGAEMVVVVRGEGGTAEPTVPTLPPIEEPTAS